METMIDLINRNATDEEIYKYSNRIQKEKDNSASLEKKAEFEYMEANNLVQLPLWQEEARGVPNCILRGSLFAAVRPQDAFYCDRKILIENDDFKITYTGMRLTQPDLDVWETALHLARNQKLGEKIYYSETSFLRKMGRSTGGNDKKWLKSVLSRLSATSVEVTFKTKKHYSFEGSLLANIYREKITEKFVLVLDPQLHRLFLDGNTWVSWEERSRIDKTQYLAKWLHGYAATHAKWLGHKPQTLLERSGSKNKSVNSFKQSLKKAATHLEAVGLIESFDFDNGLFKMEKPPSKSQQKHIEQKQEEWLQLEKERERKKVLSRNTRAD